MPTPYCHCQCKMCRAPGRRHCTSGTGCGAPPSLSPQAKAPAAADQPLDAPGITRALQRLKADCGSHSPSVVQIERTFPGLIQVDACFLSNPYASAEVMTRLHAIPAAQLERMVAHYPSQAPAIAATLAPHLGVPADCLHLANGACEVIQALLNAVPGAVLVSLPTFSAYYEFARGPVLPHHLDARQGFHLDLDALEMMIARHRPQTVVIINPNNPDGGLIPHAALVNFVHRVHSCVEQIIVDESFSAFTTEGVPDTLAGLVSDLPRLVVVNSLSKSHGIAGLRLGYAVMSAQRARLLRSTALWNLNAFAEWFCSLLGDAEFQNNYEDARRRYVRDTRSLFADLAELPDITVIPSAANFTLLELDRPAHEVTGALLADHGVYVRDCADKRGLPDDRFIRVAARSQDDNDRIVEGLRSVLSRPRVIRSRRLSADLAADLVQVP